jgi:hypothetical protein
LGIDNIAALDALFRAWSMSKKQFRKNGKILAACLLLTGAQKFCAKAEKFCRDRATEKSDRDNIR